MRESLTLKGQLVGDACVCVQEWQLGEQGKGGVTLVFGLLPIESDKQHTNWPEA